MIRFLGILAALFVLAACSSTPTGTPDGKSFDIISYFDRDVTGEGVIERGDRRLGRFKMLVKSRYEDGFLYLDETFYFEGQPEFNRVWKLKEESSGVWVGGADNVKGETRIRIIEGVVHMNYLADFPYKNGEITLRFNQQLFELGEGLVFNRSRLSKFGFPVSTVTVIFDKRDAP